MQNYVKGGFVTYKLHARKWNGAKKRMYCLEQCERNRYVETKIREHFSWENAKFLDLFTPKAVCHYNSGTWETGQMVRENYSTRTIQPNHTEQKFPVRNFPEFGKSSWVCFLQGNSGKCHSIWKFPEIQTGTLGRTKSASSSVTIETIHVTIAQPIKVKKTGFKRRKIAHAPVSSIIAW